MKRAFAFCNWSLDHLEKWCLSLILRFRHKTDSFAYKYHMVADHYFPEYLTQSVEYSYHELIRFFANKILLIYPGYKTPAWSIFIMRELTSIKSDLTASLFRERTVARWLIRQNWENWVSRRSCRRCFHLHLLARHVIIRFIYLPIQNWKKQ